MRVNRITVLFFMTMVYSGTLAQSGELETVFITLSSKQIRTEQALKEIETQTDFKFTYSNEIIRQEQVLLKDSTGTIKTILDQLFTDQSVKYVVREGKLLLVPAKVEIPLKKIVVSGYVRDGESGEAMIGANVFDASTLKGTSTNTYGFFSLTLPTDSVQLTASFVGYQSFRKDMLPRENLEMTIELLPGEMLHEVVVTGEQGIEEGTDMGLHRVSVKQIEGLPAILAETDVMKVLQLLPGVQSGMEGTSGLYVRGGGPDQNLILLDGVPVYNASHLFGAFSVFNTDAINSIELIKGGFPARYGGRLSSVVDITMKEGNKKAFSAKGSIGLISSKLTLEGPIKSEKTTFIISGRRTYIDLFSRPFSEQLTGKNTTSGYFFYDLNTKVNHQFSNKDRLYLSTYLGKDDGVIKMKSASKDTDAYYYKKEDDLGLNWGNITASLRWNHVISTKLFSNTTLIFSRYKFSIYEDYNREVMKGDSILRSEGHFLYFSGIRDYTIKADFDYILNTNHYIRFGISGTRHAFRPGAVSFKSIIEKDTIYGTPY
ncbi:MAG: TonB-dependent receptor, partial [Cyclobacteriaceae bacterium]|nr:TonB-dependent receptor [Cyclobacteriaceae bacterium]